MGETHEKQHHKMSEGYMKVIPVGYLCLFPGAWKMREKKDEVLVGVIFSHGFRSTCDDG